MINTSQRLRAVSQVLLDVHAAGDVPTLIQTVAAGLERCVGCDGALLTFARDPVKGDVQYLGSLASAARPVVAALDVRVVEQNPIYLDRLRLHLDGPATLDAVDPAGGVHLTDFGAKMLRPLRATRLLHAPNVGPVPISLMLTRSAGRDFSDDDLESVRTVGLHLTLALSKLQTANRLVRQHWLVTDRTGRILRAQPSATALLGECVGTVKQQLPQAMCEALSRRLRGFPPEVLRYALAGRLVGVYLAPIASAAGECTCTLIEQPFMSPPEEQFTALGVTRRESEVLHWMCEGKTNGEIGVILGISALTAKKHVENILHKLGVETRTAAVAHALGA
ncbi:MAG: LuxR C-terminal-related transcriptional regulator [Phycisphaerae bacterium]